MKYKLLVVIIYLVVNNLNARMVITGKVTDKGSSEPVEAATVELLQLPDSIFIEALITNSEGAFIFYKADSTENYCLRVTHVSYKRVIVPVVRKTGSKITSVGTISLDPEVVGLKEIVVSGSKILVTELPDRTVYAVSDGIRKTSTDGLDVLRKIPSVQVDYFDEKITVEGKTNIVIEVDGVTRDKDYLKRLHPKQIEKYEINTNPSGKYDPETEAVINIVTNKEMRYGLKGMVNSGVFSNFSESYQVGLNANVDYGFEKISYYLGGYGAIYDIGSNSNMNRETNAGFLNNRNSQLIDGNIAYINSGFIYDPNKLNNLNFNISYNAGNTDINSDAFNYIGVNSNINNIYRVISNTNSNSGGLNSSLFYKHKFDEKGDKNFELESTYYNSLNNNNKTNFQNVHYSLDNEEDSRDPMQIEETGTNNQSLTARAGYSVLFDSVNTISTGISTNYNLYKIDNISSLTAAPDLNYEDVRGIAFLDYSRNFKKGSVKIGSRIETSSISINSSDKSSYVSPLPYANIQYKINNKNSLKLSYTRRVIRPSSNELNPFVSVIDSQTISRGNINLKPAYRDNFQFSYTLRYVKDKFTITLAPQIFYEYRTRLIQRITKNIDNTNRVITVPENISNGYETGTGMSINAQIGKIYINSYFRYSYFHINSYLDQIDATNKQWWNLSAQIMSPFFLKMNLITGMNFNSPTLNGQEEIRTSPMYMVGLMRQLKGSSRLMIFAINPFGDYLNNRTSTIRNDNFYQKSESYLNLKNLIAINYSYNFKIGKEIKTRKPDNGQENENLNMPLKF